MNARWRRYSDEELEFLREGFKRMNMTALVSAFNEQFGRSRIVQQIKSTLANYGYKSGRGCNNVPYTEEQIAFLKQEYPNMTAKKLAVAFNAKFAPKRSLSSIRHILLRFGPRKNSRKRGAKSSYTEKQIAFLRDNYKTMTAPELQAAFNAEFKTDKQYWAIVNILKTYEIRRYRRRELKVGDETLCRATGYIYCQDRLPCPQHEDKAKLSIQTHCHLGERIRPGA